MSREYERRADRFALDYRNPAAFISAMRRLGAQNLAEEYPSRIVQWLFYSHPPLRERISAAEAFPSACGSRQFAGSVGSAGLERGNSMIVHTDYLFFNTKTPQEFIRITDDIAAIVNTSGVSEGTVLVSAMHITAGVRERLGGRPHRRLPGLARAALALRPRLPPSSDRREQCRRPSEADDHGPSGDRADHEREAGSLAVGAGVYAEFDGRRRKRVVVKAKVIIVAA